MAEGVSSEVLSGSEYMFDFYCELCKDDGKHLEAEGFCVDCGEYLCASCYNAHPKTRQTRYHDLLEKSTMPKDTPLSPDRTSKDISTKCKHHAGKPVEFYCKTHDVLGCSMCLLKDHRGCHDIELIIEKSENILDSQEYKDFIKTLNSLNQQSKDVIAKARTNISLTNTCYSDVIKSVKKLRDDVNTTLDQLEHDIAVLAKTLQSEEEEKMTVLSNESNTITESVENMLVDQHSLQSSRRVCQVYISMKESAKHIQTLHDNVNRASRALVVKTFWFKPNPKLQEFVDRPYALGEISNEAAAVRERKQAKTNQPGLLKELQEHAERPYALGELQMSDEADVVRERKQANANQPGLLKELQEYPERPYAPGELQMSDEADVVRERKQTNANQPGLLKELQEYPERPYALGELQMSNEVGTVSGKKRTKTSQHSLVKAEQIADIDVKWHMGRCESSITGSAVVSSNRLVVLDGRHRNVKLLDTGTNSNKLMDILTIPVPLYMYLIHLYTCSDVTALDSGQAAITVSCHTTHCIHVVNVSDKLAIDRKIYVSGNCHGVAYSKERLIVTYTGPPKLEIMDLSGNAINKLENDSDGEQLFHDPRFVCVSNDGDTIYVSECGRNRVISLTFDGKVKSEYSDSELKRPQKLCVDHHDYVYVCGGESRNVHMLTADLTKIQIILTQADGLDSNVYSVSHCQETNRLFVGMEDNSKLKVFQLS